MPDSMKGNNKVLIFLFLEPDVQLGSPRLYFNLKNDEEIKVDHGTNALIIRAETNEIIALCLIDLLTAQNIHSYTFVNLKTMLMDCIYK